MRTFTLNDLKDKIHLLGVTQIEVCGGNLPYTFLNCKATEHEKIVIYRQALTDLLNQFPPEEIIA